MTIRTEEREGLRSGQRAVQLQDDQLCAAVRSGRVDVASELLLSGVPPCPYDSHGVPALIAASGEGCVASVQLLLEALAAVDVCGPEHATALTMACRNGRLECVRLLLAAAQRMPKPDVVATLLSSRSSQLTPGEWALVGGHLPCALLVSTALGSEVSHTCPCTHTPHPPLSTTHHSLSSLAHPTPPHSTPLHPTPPHPTPPLPMQVRPPPPSRWHWARVDPTKHRLRPSSGKLRRLVFAQLGRNTDLCRKYGFLLGLRRALHLFLAAKQVGSGVGHIHDAACLARDLPQLENDLPYQVTLHPGD